MTVAVQNLPGTIIWKNDGNLTPEPAVVGPTALVIGTAGKGLSDSAFLVGTTTLAKSEFGTDGTLLRGMWEARTGGADQIRLYRIGSTSATLQGVGDTTGALGYTIETVELIVSDYQAVGGGPDIGTPSNFVNLEDVVAAGTTFVAGTDGLSLSRMEMYEELYVAYINLLETDFDVLIPMDIYLDDYNVIDQGHYLGAVAPKVSGWISGNEGYPTAGTYQPGVETDALGKVFVESYEGEYFFWWVFSDGAFTEADITPANVPGSGSKTLKIDGTALTADDFHEVNFAYQMGRFLYEYSTNIVDATGVIGVLPPASNSLRDKARWLGVDPTWTLNTATGDYSLTSADNDGTGLLGNKFMVGKYVHRSGVFGGGFIATETDFMDDTEIEDANEIAVDLGKYMSVVTDSPLLRNTYYTGGYLASFAASYGGFYINRAPASAPTNKPVNDASLVYKFGLGALDLLSGAGYTMLRQKTAGLVIGDSPTAARYDSDWNRLSTVRIVKAVIDGVRLAVDPYLGEGMSEASRNAMQAAIEKVLLAAKKANFLKDYKPFSIIQTPSMEVAGRAEINLVLIPAFELRQVEVTVSVSKSG